MPIGFAVDNSDYHVYGIRFKITLEQIVDATNYRFNAYRNDVLIETVETTNLVNEWIGTEYGEYSFEYMGYNDSISSDWSNKVTIKYNNKDYILVLV